MKARDYAMIGSGQGGVPLAMKLAREGEQVTMFEKSHWGGTCVNTGCIPSKTLLASAHVAASARRAETMGINCAVEVNFEEVMSRVRSSISPQDVLEGLEKAGVQTVKAAAELLGPHVVRGGDMTVEAETIVINSGKSPFVPTIEGLGGTPYLTYETFWEIEQLPKTLFVIGGGYTGVEFAQAMQRLGSKVHIFEQSERIIEDEEEDVSHILQEALEEDGVQFHLEANIQRVRYEEGIFKLTLAGAGEEILSDCLLVATGRQPNVKQLHLDRAGIETDEEGNIKVDEHFHTSAQGIYAIGDVTGQPAFTHVSWEDHRRLLNVLQDSTGERKQGDRVLGYAFFTEPQVGRVGMTLAQAKDAGKDAAVATLPLESVARAAATAHQQGFYRMVVDQENGRILGATLVSPQAAELVHVFLALMEAGATWRVLERSQHIHPTYAEGLPTLARKFK